MTRSVAALLILAGTVPAQAVSHGTARADRSDGTWSVEIIAESGSRDRAYRYPIRIEQGVARPIGLPLAIHGTVAGNGAARGSIWNGTAPVRGRLGRKGLVTGTWVASGSLECSDQRSARRRS